MAEIHDVRLEIFENTKPSTAKVSFTLLGSVRDVQIIRLYHESVELIGVDALPGEASQNERLPGVIPTTAIVRFRNTNPLARSSTFLFPLAALDEDPGFTFPNEDEIAARVTLKPIVPATVSRMSNIVRRGGLVNQN